VATSGYGWEECMTVKTWQDVCEEHPDHEGIVTYQMIQDRMQEEIDALRQQLAEVTEQRDGLAEALHAVYGMWGSDNPMPEAFLDASLIAKAALAQRRKEEGK
jgi:hypothetical protein